MNVGTVDADLIQYRCVTGMLSRVLPLRRAQAAEEQRRYLALSEEERATYAPPLRPLKLIIMSATMRVGDFQSPVLFPTGLPPVISVEARQYPVTTHFSKRTETRNYLQEVHKKVCQIHRKLPEGGVLVFLTGKQEILYMCHKLNRSLNKKGRQAGKGDQQAAAAEQPQTAQSETAIEAVGLGASAEEQMELLEGDGAELLAGDDGGQDSGDGLSKPSKKGKRGEEKGENSSEGDRAARREKVREMLGQDGIESDSDASDGESGHSEDEGRGADEADEMEGIDRPAAPTAAAAKEVTAEEAVFILDGDDNSNAKKKTATASAQHASALALSSGDAIRDQMLREALGADLSTIADNSALVSGSGVSDASAATEGAASASAGAAIDLPAAAEEAPVLRAWILPLYALMPAAQQNRVFQPPPPGHRLIVVATNVAETSITIPGIRYVVDCGRQKEKVITAATTVADEAEEEGTGKRSFEGTKVVPNDVLATAGAATGAGIAKYEVNWVSQAAALQRQGRAGRTGPGHCYRLYSANFFHHYMQPYQPPEITVTPLEELILQVSRLVWVTLIIGFSSYLLCSA